MAVFATKGVNLQQVKKIIAFPLLWKRGTKEKSILIKFSIIAVILGFAAGSGLLFNLYFFSGIILLFTVYFILLQPIIGLLLLITFDLAIPIFTGSLILMAIGTVGIISLILLSLFRKGLIFSPTTMNRTPIDNLLFILMFVSIIYAFIGILRSNELDSIIGDLYNLIIKMCLLFFITVSLINERGTIKKLASGFLIVTLIFSVGYLILYFSGGIEKFIGTGGGATFYQQSEFIRIGFAPGFPTFHLLVFLGLWFYSDSIKKKMLIGIVILLVSIILALTLKRTYWISSFMSLLFLFFMLGYHEKIKVMKNMFWGGIISLLILILYISLSNNLSENITFYLEMFSERMESINDPQDESLGNRFQEYSDVITAISNNPFGYGLGSKIRAFSANERRIVYKHYIHNSYLFYTVQIGILGISIYLIALLIFFKEAFNLNRYLSDKWLKGLNLGILTASMCELINSLTTLSFNTIYISIAMGIVFAIKKNYNKENHSQLIVI